MQICQICFTNESFITPCNCYMCMQCLLNWFAAKNADLPTYEFYCPNAKCNYMYTRSELQKLCIYPQYQLCLSEILLKEYLKNQDIKPCPNGKCKNYGFINLHQKCDSQLQCPSCYMNWTDLSVASFSVQLDYGISNMFSNVKDFTYCFFSANECPQCGVQIQRKGGCKHMTCKACQHQFCWNCKNDWHGHRTYNCGLQQLIYYGIHFLMILSLLQTLQILVPILHYALIPIQWVLFIIMANAIPFGFVVGAVYFFYGWSLIYDSQLKIGSLTVLISTVSLLIWYYLHNIISDLFDLSISMFISTVLWEGIIAVVIVCYLFRKQLSWIMYPIAALSLLYFFGLNGLCLLMWGYPMPNKTQFIRKQQLQLGAFLLFMIMNIFDLINAIIECKVIYIFMIHVLVSWYTDGPEIKAWIIQKLNIF